MAFADYNRVVTSRAGAAARACNKRNAHNVLGTPAYMRGDSSYRMIFDPEFLNVFHCVFAVYLGVGVKLDESSWFTLY